MTLPLLSATWQGITFGPLGDDTDVYLGKDGAAGLGQAPRRTAMTSRSGGGAAGGSSVSMSRQVTCSAWLDVTQDAEMLQRVVASMNERPDPRDELPLSLAGFPLWPGHEVRVYARPESCDPVMSQMAAEHGVSAFQLVWIAPDPTVYSEAAIPFGDDDVAVTTPGSHLDFVIDNVGTRTVKPGRALTFVINAHGGAVRDPYVEADGRRTTWVGKLEAGQSIRLYEDRSSWTGNAWRDGWVRGSSPLGLTASPAATWPLLKPGETTLRFGAKSGPIAVSGEHRSTW